MFDVQGRERADCINVGIVGYGYAGAVIHPALIARVPGLRLRAVATRDETRRRAAAATGLLTFATLEDMLESDVQVVVVATPHDTHEALACAALEARRHVVCEKVMALSAASAERMMSAARQSGCVLTVFHNRRWDSDFLTIRRAIDAGVLGAVHFVEIAVHTHKSPRTWRADAARSGGLLFDWGAHLVDQALRLIDARVVGVSGFRQYRPDASGCERETMARCHLRFDGGQMASVEVSYASRLSRPRWTIVGARGTLLKDGMDRQEAAIRAGQDPSVVSEDPAQRARVHFDSNGAPVEAVLPEVPGRWLAFYENLHGALRNEEALRVPAREARDVVAVLEAHAKAAREGREIAPDMSPLPTRS